MFKRPSERFSFSERENNYKRISEEVYDLCIIGGGITGAGTARDAASRGMKVCLIEKDDFASGTSSRSSKLIHGGIRYLENLEFGLVFEALNERHVLFEIAPHLVHPINFILPVYKNSRVGMFKMGLGMWLYDALALFHAPKFHERLSSLGTLSRFPSLQKEGLVGSYLYSDAYMDDDRLVVETMRSAHRHGACLLNYVKAGQGRFDEKGRLQSLEVEDQLHNRKSSVRARHFISTVGPWTDQFASSLFEWKKILRPTKGIHFTLRRERLDIRDALVMATGDDRRIIFAIPRNDMIIIGTTDTEFKDDPASVHSEKSDVNYLLEVVKHYFSEAKITEEDIISTYAGVRPLVEDGSPTESKTSREHIILNTSHNVTFVAGGKYTTYRRMSRDIIEDVLKKEFTLEQRIQFARNQTREVINPQVTIEKLSESLAQSVGWAAEFGITESQSFLLAQRHGYEALQILEEAEEAGVTEPWAMEALFASRYTLCQHIRDFMLRRSPLFLSQPDHGMSLLEPIAHVFQQEFDWSADRLQQEKDLYRQHLEFELGWRTRQVKT